MRRQLSILVSGAGIAGPTLAYWLLRAGFAPTLIECAPHFRKGGYMIDFWGAGFDVAEKMNLLPRLREIGYHFDRLKFVDELGRTRSELGGRAFRGALGERFISLQRGDLARAIFDKVTDKIEIIFHDSITAIREDPSGLDVSFERSSPRRFDLVVGCDGLHSAVRQVVFGSEQQFEKFLGYYAASFLTTDYPHREELTYVSFGAPGDKSVVMHCATTGLLSFSSFPETVRFRSIRTKLQRSRSWRTFFLTIGGLRSLKFSNA